MPTLHMLAEVGHPAPTFTLTATDGTTVSLAALVGKPVVLYFYPKDMTPGCTQEACDFRDSSAELKKLGAVVLGVSPDSLDSHAKFTQTHALNFPLLADVDHAVCEAYGAWTEKDAQGQKSFGVTRSTFLIDKAGKIARAWRGVKVAGHVQEVLAALKDLKN